MKNVQNAEVKTYITIVICSILFVIGPFFITGWSSYPYIRQVATFPYELIETTSKVGLKTTDTSNKQDASVSQQFHQSTRSTTSTPNNRKFLIYNSLIGRFGNQLFSYAALLSLANQSGRIPIITTKPKMYSYFPSLTIPVISSKQLQQTHCRNDSRRVSASSRNGFSSGYFTHVIENIISLKETCVRIGTGYLFSYKYFNSMKETIMQQFTFTPEIRQLAEKQICTAVQSLFKNQSCDLSASGMTMVGIHNRRGDSVKLKTTRQLNSTYFVMAIEKICNILKHNSSSDFTGRNEVAFLLFGDDSRYNEELSTILRLQLPWIRITTVRSSNPAVDLQSIALCSHVITSTGTFSWWAAYMSGGLKLYPYPSVSPEVRSYKEEDRYEKSWIKIQF